MSFGREVSETWVSEFIHSTQWSWPLPLKPFHRSRRKPALQILEASADLGDYSRVFFLYYWHPANCNKVLPVYFLLCMSKTYSDITLRQTN